jgi:hypothetical protein
MLRFDVLPLVGLGSVSFDSSRAACREAFGVPTHSERDADFYLRNSLKVAFDEEGRIEYIEAALDETLEFVYRGVDLFATPASEVVALFASEAPFEEYMRRYDSGYIFDELEIALWRWELVEGPAPVLESIVIGSPGYFSRHRWLLDPFNERYFSTEGEYGEL